MQTEPRTKAEAADAEPRDIEKADRKRKMDYVHKIFEQNAELVEDIGTVCRAPGPFVDGKRRVNMTYIDVVIFFNEFIENNLDDVVWFFDTFKGRLCEADSQRTFVTYVVEMNSEDRSKFRNFINKYGIMVLTFLHKSYTMRDDIVDKIRYAYGVRTRAAESKAREPLTFMEVIDYTNGRVECAGEELMEFFVAFKDYLHKPELRTLFIHYFMEMSADQIRQFRAFVKNVGAKAALSIWRV